MVINLLSLIFIGLIKLVSLTKESRNFTTNEYKATNGHFHGSNNEKYSSELIFNGKKFSANNYDIENIRYDFDVIKKLNLAVEAEFDDIIHVTITDPEHVRWNASMLISDNYHQRKQSHSSEKKKSLESLGFSINEDPFSFELKNPETNEIYYSWKNGKFIFSENLIVFESFLTSNNIYGFGERTHDFKLNEGIYTIWPNDTGTELDHEHGGKNLYGVQPFGLHRTKGGLFVGILFLNINAQDLIIKTLDSDRVALEHRTIGGIIDLFVFTGKTPEEVIKKLHSIIGFPALPPYWALGWHQCRFGYRTDDKVKEIIDLYDKFEVPFDTMWTDIDYMEDYRDFTVAKERYPNLKNIVNELHSKGQYYMPIIDIGIPKNDTDYFYNLGLQMDMFIKSNYTGKPLVNEVWPGNCVFPDWFHPNASIFWHMGFEELNKILDFDGMWEDMNEPSVMYTVGVGIGELDAEGQVDPSKNKYEYIPYIPGNGNADLISRQISVNALNYGNPDLMTVYNTKPLTSFLQSLSTYEYLLKINKRPFILSRSSVIGLGRYAIHWLGDNYSTYESMKQSIPGVFNYQMFGFSMMGADICGFNNNATDTLCARWHVLGAFYPFSRNHNMRDTISQEPFNIGPITLEATRNALLLRYSLIRYLYTQLFLVSIRGGTVFRPVFFDFPDDLNTYQNIEDSFMFGDSFIMYPVFSDKDDSINVYFPNSIWNTFPDGIKNISYVEKRGGVHDWVSGKFNNVNLFIRGGKIVPRQETKENKILRTNQLRNIPTELYISLDHEQKAEGELIFDDGYSVDSLSNKDFLHLRIKQNGNKIIFEKLNDFKTKYKFNDIYLSKIVILNATKDMLTDTCLIFINHQTTLGFNLNYDELHNIITIEVFEKTFVSFAEIDSIVLDNYPKTLTYLK